MQTYVQSGANIITKAHQTNISYRKIVFDLNFDREISESALVSL